MSDGGLSPSFVAHLPEERPAIRPPAPELEAALAALWRQARAAWPDIELDPCAFAAHVAAHAALRDDLVASLGQLRAADLYLAWACVRGHEAAIKVFVERYDPILEAALARVPDASHKADDVKQVLLERLLLARDGRRPGLAGYAGRGDLGAYLQVAATREALKVLRSGRRRPDRARGDLAELAAPADSPELQVLKDRYRGAFKAAFQEAIGGLASRDRQLLRYHYLDRLTTRQIGVIYRAHSSTVTRWIARIRGALLDGTRRRLQERLAIGPGEFDSLMRLVESQLEVSIERVLESDAIQS